MGVTPADRSYVHLYLFTITQMKENTNEERIPFMSVAEDAGGCWRSKLHRTTVADTRNISACPASNMAGQLMTSQGRYQHR